MNPRCFGASAYKSIPWTEMHSWHTRGYSACIFMSTYLTFDLHRSEAVLNVFVLSWVGITCATRSQENNKKVTPKVWTSNSWISYQSIFRNHWRRDFQYIDSLHTVWSWIHEAHQSIINTRFNENWSIHQHWQYLQPSTSSKARFRWISS
jgi:hypothetical protein